jgi:hypothetical protein
MSCRAVAETIFVILLAWPPCHCIGFSRPLRLLCLVISPVTVLESGHFPFHRFSLARRYDIKICQAAVKTSNEQTNDDVPVTSEVSKIVRCL